MNNIVSRLDTALDVAKRERGNAREKPESKACESDQGAVGSRDAPRLALGPKQQCLGSATFLTSPGLGWSAPKTAASPFQPPRAEWCVWFASGQASKTTHCLLSEAEILKSGFVTFYGLRIPI